MSFIQKISIFVTLLAVSNLNNSGAATAQDFSIPENLFNGLAQGTTSLVARVCNPMIERCGSVPIIVSPMGCTDCGVTAIEIFLANALQNKSVLPNEISINNITLDLSDIYQPDAIAGPLIQNWNIEGYNNPILSPGYCFDC